MSTPWTDCRVHRKYQAIDFPFNVIVITASSQLLELLKLPRCKGNRLGASSSSSSSSSSSTGAATASSSSSTSTTSSAARHPHRSRGLATSRSPRAEDLHLADVRVSSVLVHGADRDLDKVRAQVADPTAAATITSSTCPSSQPGLDVCQRDSNPPVWLRQFDRPHLAQVVKCRSTADRNLLGCVRLVKLVVEVEKNLADGSPASCGRLSVKR